MFGKKSIFRLMIIIVILTNSSFIINDFSAKENQDDLNFNEDNLKLDLENTKYKKNLDNFVTEINIPDNNYDLHRKNSENKLWTYMLYLDADNDIEVDAIRDFEWLEEAGGSDENISIVVLFDRIPGYDNTHGNWSGSRIYNITEDVSPDTIDSQLMVDLGEVNMANPTTLTDFITYCFEYFPAENYILDLWDHGHAAYGVIDDETSSSHFIVNDIQTAVNNALATSTEEIDIISMDACDMNTIEVAWEMRNLCKYFISSEDSTNGYPYKLIVEELKMNPYINVSSFCELMVDAYATHYRFVYYNCLSVINQTKFPDLPEIFNSFITELIITLETGYYDDLFVFSRDLAREFYDGCWVDLVTLIENIIYFIDKPTLTLEGEELLDFFDQLIVYNWQQQNYAGKANGLTIFMPYEFFSYDYIDDYCSGQSYCANMDWQTDTLWDEFLGFYWNNHLNSKSVEPQLLNLEEPLVNYSIIQNSTQMFRINFWQKSIYEFTCLISLGDVDIKIIKFDYSGVYELIGGSFLVNPDDGSTEKCRFRLETGFYLIFVYGKISTSYYDLEVKEYEPINLVCNSPYAQTTGTINGDIQDHFIQDLNHYFQIEIPYGNNTIIVSNSDLINTQLKVYNDQWQELFFGASASYGEVISFVYNHTSENPIVFILEICGIDGAGDFTVEVRNPSEPTPKVGFHLWELILILPFSLLLVKKRKSKMKI